MESDIGSTKDLEDVIKLCKKHNIAKIRIDDIEIEFGPNQHTEITDDQIRTMLQKYRPTADKENKEFEQTLFWSAQ